MCGDNFAKHENENGRTETRTTVVTLSLSRVPLRSRRLAASTDVTTRDGGQQTLRVRYRFFLASTLPFLSITPLVARQSLSTPYPTRSPLR